MTTEELTQLINRAFAAASAPMIAEFRARLREVTAEFEARSESRRTRNRELTASLATLAALVDELHERIGSNTAGPPQQPRKPS